MTQPEMVKVIIPKDVIAGMATHPADWAMIHDVVVGGKAMRILVLAGADNAEATAVHLGYLDENDVVLLDERHHKEIVP